MLWRLVKELKKVPKGLPFCQPFMCHNVISIKRLVDHVDDALLVDTELILGILSCC